MRRFLALAAFALFPSIAAAAPVSVEGRTFEFPGGLGYCDLDASQPGEKYLIDQQTQIQAGQNIIIGYQGACNELIALRVGANQYLQEYMIAMVPMQNGAFTPMTGDRASFLQQMAASLPAVDPAVVEQLKAEGAGVKVSGAQLIGVLGQDDNAIYYGLLLEVSDGTTSLTAAAVVAITLIGDVPVSLNFYRPYKGLADIDALSMEASIAAANLVAANP